MIRLRPTRSLSLAVAESHSTADPRRAENNCRYLRDTGRLAEPEGVWWKHACSAAS
jgi:hypothetical protein